MNAFEHLESLIFDGRPDINPKEVYSEIVMARDFYDLLIDESDKLVTMKVSYTSVFGVPITVVDKDSINSMSVRLALKKRPWVTRP